MAQVDVYNLRREKVDQVQLDDQVFAAEVKDHLHYDIVKMQMANRRSGTACTKTRANVAFSTAKLYRQKGTGNARIGSRKSPTLRGGGTIFGPLPRDFSYRIPRQARKAALRSAISARTIDERLLLLDSFSLPEVKTKAVAEVMKKFGLTTALVIDVQGNDRLRLSARNLHHVKYVAAGGINVADVLRFDFLVMTVAAARAIEGALKK